MLCLVLGFEMGLLLRLMVLVLVWVLVLRMWMLWLRSLLSVLLRLVVCASSMCSVLFLVMCIVLGASIGFCAVGLKRVVLMLRKVVLCRMVLMLYGLCM